MHIADVATGNLGANGIVGGGIPIATGAALASSCSGSDRVVVSFFGDGAANEGAFHEALNLAAIWKLPVVFVCENNKYGMSFSTELSIAVDNIAERAAAYGMPGVTVDGNDVEAVDDAVHARVDARPGRRRPDAGRDRDLPLEGPHQERQEPLPHPRGDRRVARARPDRCGSSKPCASAARSTEVDDQAVRDEATRSHPRGRPHRQRRARRRRRPTSSTPSSPRA